MERSWGWWYVLIIPAMAESINRRIAFQDCLGKKDPISKITRKKWLGT
jgi:hypothetical protein